MQPGDDALGALSFHPVETDDANLVSRELRQIAFKLVKANS